MVLNSLLAAFRKLFGKASSASSVLDLPAGDVRPEEPLARFLLSSSEFSSTKGLVKPQAFLPRPQDLTTSVFRVQNLPAERIWPIGISIAETRRKTLYGRADILADAVMSVGLRLDPDDNPPRHANIVGWPNEKDHRLSLAQQLAAAAVLVRRSN